MPIYSKFRPVNKFNLLIDNISDSYRWSLINKIGKLKSIRSSYIWILIVPILSKILLKIKDEVEITLFGTTWELSLSLPFSWKVFYFSAIAFSLANLLYFIFCPKFITKFQNFGEYKDKGYTETALKEFFVKLYGIKRVHTNIADVRGFILGFHEYFETSISSIYFVEKMEEDTDHVLDCVFKEGSLADAFLYIQYDYDNLYPVTRVACFLLYVIGFCLLAWVFIDSFWYVFKLTFTSLPS